MSAHHTFTPVQRQAIHAPGSVAILAGAGSGKTRVLTERILTMLERGAHPGEILAVTFTDQAASELRERIQKRVEQRAHDCPERWSEIQTALRLMQVSTLHSLCARIARDHAAESGAGLSYDVLEPTDAELWRQQHLAQVLSELSPDAVAAVPSKLRNQVLRTLLDDPLRANRALEQATDGQGADALTHKIQVLYRQVAARFDVLKAETEIATFADLERWAWRALQHQAVRDHYATRWTSVLVDEMQDTTPQQWAILHALLGEGTNLTVVGDEKQSIYAFRGALPEVFRDATHTVLERGGDELSMHQSFRTTPELLNPLNSTLQQLMPGPDTQRPTATVFQPLEAARPGRAGAHLPSLELQVVQGGQSRSRTESVARLFAGRMQGLLGQPIFDRQLGDWRGARLSDMALLIRGRTHLKVYEAALTEAGLPYVVHGGLGLYDRPEVRDAITFLRTLADPSDDLLLTALLSGPYFGWPGDALLELSQSRHEGESLWHCMCRETQYQETADQLYAWRQASAHLSASQLLRQADEQTGMAQAHAALPDGSRRTGNLRLLHMLLRRWAQAGDRDLLRVARRLGQLQRLHAQQAEAPITTGDAIQILTVHASKGLEYPIVFYGEALQHVSPPPPLLRFDPYLGLVLRHDETPQWLKAQETATERENSERERLNYVAMTRAADHLILAASAADTSKQTAALHHFLAAFPPEVTRTYFTTGEIPISPPLRLREDKDRLVLDLHLGPGLALPGHLPVTGISSYDRCPRQFAYRYLAGYLPLAWLWCDDRQEDLISAEPQRAAGRDIGDAVHKAIEHGWTARAINRNNRHLTPNDREEVIQLVERLATSSFEPLRHYDFRREVTFQHQIGPITLHGIIDAIDLERGLIVDYKTDREPQPEDHLLQVSVYAQHYRVHQAALVYLRHDHIHWFRPDELERGCQHVKTLVKRMNVHDFAPTPQPAHCATCIYHGVCDQAELPPEAPV